MKIKIEQLSYFAKLAYCASCFEHYLINKKFEREYLNIVIKLIWSFTDKDLFTCYFTLESYTNNIRDIVPYFLLDYKSYYDYKKDVQSLNIFESQFNYLYKVYKQLKEIELYNLNYIIQLLYNFANFPYISDAYRSNNVFIDFKGEDIKFANNLYKFMMSNDLEFPNIKLFQAFTTEDDINLKHDEHYSFEDELFYKNQLRSLSKLLKKHQ